MVDLSQEYQDYPRLSSDELIARAIDLGNGGELRQKVARFVLDCRNSQASLDLLKEQRRTIWWTRIMAISTALMAAATVWLALETRKMASQQAPIPPAAIVEPAALPAPPDNK